MSLPGYGVVVAAHLDPIEKKPLYHFRPGKAIFSVGSFGCNLSCAFCQNHDISQQVVRGKSVSPEELADLATEIPGNIGVAFTYNEPGIWYEYVLDSAPFLKAKGQAIVLVTNGYLEEEPFRELCRNSDAMNIDLKGFTDDFYRKNCGGSIEPVKRNIRIAKEMGVHVELTNLVVTGLNDRISEFEALVDWVAGVSPMMPLHISRYFPQYRTNSPATDPDLLLEFYGVAARKLRFVFLGNLGGAEGRDTLCPECGTVLIRRKGYSTETRFSGGSCACGRSLQTFGIKE